MSSLPVEVTNELSQVLEALQSRDNAPRAQAEAILDSWTSKGPSELLVFLVGQIGHSHDSSVRVVTSPSPFNSTKVPGLCCLMPRSS